MKTLLISDQIKEKVINKGEELFNLISCLWILLILYDVLCVWYYTRVQSTYLAHVSGCFDPLMNFVSAVWNKIK